MKFVNPGDIIDYYDTSLNPRMPYARCIIYSIINNGKGVNLKWYKDIADTDGYRTFDPNIINNDIISYRHYRDRVLLKKRENIKIMIRHKSCFNDDLFVL